MHEHACQLYMCVKLPLLVQVVHLMTWYRNVATKEHT